MSSYIDPRQVTVDCPLCGRAIEVTLRWVVQRVDEDSEVILTGVDTTHRGHHVGNSFLRLYPGEGE